MKLMFTGYAHELDAELARARLHRRAQLRRLRGDAAAVARGAREAVPDRLRRSGRRHDVERAARAPRSARRTSICCDVGGTSTDISLVADGQPFVNNTFELEHDLIINALSTEISSVGAGGGSIVSISPCRRRAGRPGQRGRRARPRLLRPRRHRADDHRCLPADGDPRPRRVRRRRDAPRRRSRTAGIRLAGHAAAAERADRLRLPDRGPATSPRRSPTSRSGTASIRATSA